ncbi:LORF2 protein, partial [Anseranas semipalmata]|nr:LORF2 protein [Anseranas semipalmata]
DRIFPLCPLLFSQAIETLARKIRNNSQIQGINTEGVESRISLRADDTLLYITKPGTSAPAASDLIEERSFAAGYKMSPNTRLRGRDSFLWEC